MATRAFKLDPRVTVGSPTWTVSAGTMDTALTKTGIAAGGFLTPASSPPSNEPRITSGTNGQLGEIRMGQKPIMEEIDALLKSGATVTSARLLVYGENKSATGKNLSIKWVGKTSEPELTKAVATFLPAVAATEAEIAEKLSTAAKIEEAGVVLTHLTAKELWLWEAYVEIDIAEAASPLMMV